MTRLTSLLAASLLVLCALGTNRASAQAAPTAVGPGTSIRIGGGVSLASDAYGQRWLAGTNSWLDVNPLWRYGVEAETRSLNLHKDPNGSRYATYLVGPRIVILPGKIQPYVKVMAGAGTFQYPFGYGHGTYFAAAAGGGVDLRWTRSLNIRVVDIELQDWPQFTFGPLRPYSVSAGITLRLFRGSTQPGGLHR